ncbi:MAG TPA: helix-turn-helix transcriptional regulator [Thermomicrobiales bacterium]|nr:helix-turn-helix transcriptional regulator [Thermomicrobiales bacterium]
MVQRPIIQRQRIGPAIRRMRRMQGKTLDDLASQAGISASHLSRLERGHTLPSFQVLSDIAHVLGADVDDFVRLELEVTTLDAELQEILDARGFSEDLQGELLATSIELRQALFEAFKAYGATSRRRSRSGGGRNGRGDGQPATSRSRESGGR